MTITHRQAFELLHRDAPIDPESQRQLDEHLASCAECRQDQAFYTGLQAAAPTLPSAMPDPQGALVAVVTERLRRQRTRQRLFQPIASFGWASAALLLVAFLGWAITTLRPGTSVPSSQLPFFPAPPLASQPLSTPSAGQPTPAIPCSVPTYYTVQPGDSLASIASQHDVTIESIKSFNYLSNDATLQAGQVLEIPTCAHENLPALQRWFSRMSEFLQWTPWIQFTWDHPWLAGMLPAMILALVGVLLSQRRDYPWAEQTWLAVLLLALGLAMTLLYIVSNITSANPLLPFILTPLGGSALAALILHWWSTPQVRTLPMKIILGLSLLALLIQAAQPGWSELGRLEQILILLLGGLCALLWRAWESRNWLRFLASGFLGLSLLAGACMALGADEITAQELPEWLKATIVVFVVFSLPGSALLAGRLVYLRLAKPGALALRPLLFSLAGVLLICAILFAVFWVLATSAKVGEDTIITLWVFYFMTAAAALIAMLACAWRLDGWRKLAAALVLAAFLLALAPATRGPAATADEMTLARAAQVDQAIQRFHARTGSYPSSLGELTPWSMLYIPAPVTYYRQVWCYEGGADFYRLGYYYSPQFDHWPYAMEVRIYNSAGPQPTTPSPCEIELEAYRARYNK
ncbi:MAG TPA: LysM peptidoglycan-binding domain-containing protein [Anaerolineales bacterium]|nr:LysM peptidoglycan-binding domain-containing protein [Anaerolineales bacterium]